MTGYMTPTLAFILLLCRGDTGLQILSYRYRGGVRSCYVRAMVMKITRIFLYFVMVVTYLNK